jgi:protein-tyrosine phosphatase
MTGHLGAVTDLHSHLVPGVDDGSRTLQEALEGLGKLKDAGVGRVVTTPHLDGSLTRDPGGLEDRLKEVDLSWSSLLAGVEREFPEMELHRGFEVMLDVPDPDLSDDRLHLAGTRFVLVEWPWLGVPPGTLRVLARLRESGAVPVLAHPERYRGMEGLEVAGDWRSMGALLQVNFGSLVGRYGEIPQGRAFALLERGWVDLLSSDFHGRPHLSPDLEEAREVMSELGGEEQFEILSGVNTLRLLRGEDPVPVPPLAPERGIWERLRSFFR